MAESAAPQETRSGRTPWTVALTGGVAAGKSAVAGRFAALGVGVHAADEAARAAVAPGSAALAGIVEAFGPGVLDANGALDRKAVRQQVFDDPQARRRLEAIVHPAVHRWLLERIGEERGPYCILDIPLLAETWPQYDWVDRVLVVDAPDELRLQRLMQRDGIDARLAERMLGAQASREQRLRLADDVIENTGGESELDQAVKSLHQRYLELAGAARG